MRTSLKAVGIGLAAVLAGGSLLTSCDWAKSSLHEVNVTDAASGVSGIPSRVPAGQYEFNLVSSLPQPSLQVARLGQGYSLSQLFKDVPVVFGPPSPGFSAAAKRLYSNVAFEGGRNSAGTYSAFLTPGNYLAIDTNTNKYQTFAVSEAKVQSNFPAANLNVGGVMSMVNGKDHFSWDVTGTRSKAGTIKFTAVNGDEPHFLSVSYLHPGSTLAQCTSFEGDGPNPYCDDVLDTGVISPLSSMTIPYSFTKGGSYVLACFVGNEDTGVPHAMEGMVKTISLH